MAIRGDPNGYLQLAERLQSSTLTSEETAERIAEAKEANDKIKRANAERKQELLEERLLHDVLLSRLPPRVREPTNPAVNQRRAPGAPPTYGPSNSSGKFTQRAAIPMLSPAGPARPSFTSFPAEPPNAPVSARAPAPATTAAFSPRRAPLPTPAAMTWKPAGVQPLHQSTTTTPAAAAAATTTATTTTKPGERPPREFVSGWRDEDYDDYMPDSGLPELAGKVKPRRQRRNARHSRELPVNPAPTPAAAAVTQPSEPDVSCSPRMARATDTGPPSRMDGQPPFPPPLKAPKPQQPPAATEIKPGTPIYAISHGTLPPVPPPSPGPFMLSSPLLNHGPPSTGVLTWARDQAAEEGAIPRRTEVPPASDEMERRVVEGMQRRLLAAKRRAIARESIDGGVAAAAMSDEEILKAYPSLVYAAYDPSRRPHQPSASPRRLLSNRWNSSVMHRTHDVRIALQGTDDVFGIDTAGPKVSAPSGALSARAALPSQQAQIVDGASLLDAWPSASPEAAGIAYRAQILEQTVEGYERPARWRVPGV